MASVDTFESLLPHASPSHPASPTIPWVLLLVSLMSRYTCYHGSANNPRCSLYSTYTMTRTSTIRTPILTCANQLVRLIIVTAILMALILAVISKTILIQTRTTQIRMAQTTNSSSSRHGPGPSRLVPQILQATSVSLRSLF